MSDWTYEPLIVKLKAALAEAESGTKSQEPSRAAPKILERAAPGNDREPDLRRS
jgi:hypothetical protein